MRIGRDVAISQRTGGQISLCFTWEEVDCRHVSGHRGNTSATHRARTKGQTALAFRTIVTVPLGICVDCPESKSRSEEHTSELQSHLNLVCRLLLQKKKIT